MPGPDLLIRYAGQASSGETDPAAMREWMDKVTLSDGRTVWFWRNEPPRVEVLAVGYETIEQDLHEKDIDPSAVCCSPPAPSPARLSLSHLRSPLPPSHASSVIVRSCRYGRVPTPRPPPETLKFRSSIPTRTQIQQVAWPGRTEEASDALRALGLERGDGLVVDFVNPIVRRASGLQKNDVLVELGDQFAGPSGPISKNWSGAKERRTRSNSRSSQRKKTSVSATLAKPPNERRSDLEGSGRSSGPVDHPKRWKCCASI